jgi:hypothetical protein
VPVAIFSPMTDASSSARQAPPDDFAVAVRLTASTARRISHQIERTVQGTYGAHDGLRELVHLGTQQMLVAGASREAIRREITLCISDRLPTTITTEPALSRHKAEMVKLTTLMLTWADECPAPRPR